MKPPEAEWPISTAASNGDGGRHRRVLVAGGAGFIGTHLTASLLRSGATVVVLDNLSRPGSAAHLQWLRQLPQNAKLLFVHGDIADRGLVDRLCRDADEIFHLAAQVAVTHSIADPRLDFDTNLGGTFNLLEGARRNPGLRFFLFTSTNKVYGSLDADRAAVCPPRGFDENQRLDFHSPYSCSKGAADQYVRDYARVYRVPTVVFRMSCIYGPQQFGTEDQGWVAHFILAALNGRPVTLYGDGGQVRDLLYVEDLVAAFEAARRHRRAVAGGIFNIGGGRGNARSLRQVIAEIERLGGHRLGLRQGPPRQGDQRRYVSDTTRFERATGWRPQVPVRDGLDRLYRWLLENRATWEATLAEPAALAG